MMITNTWFQFLHLEASITNKILLTTMKISQTEIRFNFSKIKSMKIKLSRPFKVECFHIFQPHLTDLALVKDRFLMKVQRDSHRK